MWRALCPPSTTTPTRASMVIAEIGLYMGMREVDAEVASIERDFAIEIDGGNPKREKPLNLCLSEKGEKGLFGNKEGDDALTDRQLT